MHNIVPMPRCSDCRFESHLLFQSHLLYHHLHTDDWKKLVKFDVCPHFCSFSCPFSCLFYFAYLPTQSLADFSNAL